MPEPFDFLSGPPAPVEAVARESSMRVPPPDVLPQSIADQLLGLDGVDGAWIERMPSGERVVVLHYSRTDQPRHLPRQVQGLPVKVVGGEPIQAQR
jgi:hypothetical protein